jgi:hypothetical protein
MYGERSVKMLLGDKPGGGRKERRTLNKVDGWCLIGLEEYGYKKMEN